MANSNGRHRACESIRAPLIHRRYGVDAVDGLHDYGALIGSACYGTIVGELILIECHNQYSVTVKADIEGAAFVGIDRAAFWNFVDVTNMAPAGAPAQVAAALRAACCQRILEMAPSDRGEADLQALVAFLRGLQVQNAWV